MADWTLPTSAPIPFARKGEASPAVKTDSKLAPASAQLQDENQPLASQPAEIPAEESGLAMLASLIRRGSHRAPAPHSDASDEPLSDASLPAPFAAMTPPVLPEPPAPARPAPDLLTHQAPTESNLSPAGFAMAIQRRRQLTLRLTAAQFARFRTFAVVTGSTYQGVLASMVQLFLDAMTPASAATEAKAVVEPPAETSQPGFQHQS